MKYEIVLDQFASKIVPSETGMTFNQAIKEILDYVSEAGYSLQEAYFQVLRDEGEDSLDKFSLVLE